MFTKSMIYGLLLAASTANAYQTVSIGTGIKPSTSCLSGWCGIDVPSARTVSFRTPVEIMRMLDDEMEDLMNKSWKSPAFSVTAATAPTISKPMAMDVVESKESYQLMIDLPGIDSKDIDIALKGEELTISAKREETKAEEGSDIRRTERRTGSFSRTLTLPEDADGTSIKAENKNGVLKVTIGKKASEVPKERKIEIVDRN